MEERLSLCAFIHIMRAFLISFFSFSFFVMHGRPAGTSNTTVISFVPASALAQNGAVEGVCVSVTNP